MFVSVEHQMTFLSEQLDFALLKFPSVSIVSDTFLYFQLLLWHNKVSHSDTTFNNCRVHFDANGLGFPFFSSPCLIFEWMLSERNMLDTQAVLA